MDVAVLLPKTSTPTRQLRVVSLVVMLPRTVSFVGALKVGRFACHRCIHFFGIFRFTIFFDLVVAHLANACGAPVAPLRHSIASILSFRLLQRSLACTGSVGCAGRGAAAARMTATPPWRLEASTQSLAALCLSAIAKRQSGTPRGAYLRRILCQALSLSERVEQEHHHHQQLQLFSVISFMCLDSWGFGGSSNAALTN